MPDLAVALLPAFGALLCAGLAIYCWRRPDTLAAREFAVFAAFAFLWTFFNTFETLSVAAGPRIAFSKLSYLGIAYAPVAWVVFLLRYSQRDRWLRPGIVAALSLIPSATLLLALTEPAHGLLWSGLTFVLEPYPELIIEHGPWFNLIHIPYSYGLYLAGLGLLLGQMISGSGKQRRQSLALVVALLLPFGINVLYTVSGFTLRGLDPTPSMIALSAILIGAALFGTGLLRDAPLSYRTVFLHSSDGIILTDPAGRVLDANPAALGRFELRNVRLRHLSEAFPPLQRALDEHPGDPATSPVRYASELLPGHTFEVRDHALHTVGGHPAGRALMVRDVTHEERARETLERQAEIDPLTALPNRRALQRRADRALDRSDHDPVDVALLYLDLDGFKRINDLYGHATGDAVLRQVADRLRYTLRDGDFIARVGGDEFAVLVNCDAPAAAVAVRRRLQEALEHPFDVDGDQHIVGTSIGLARSPEHGITLDTLLHHADAAMYRDKRARNSGSNAPLRASG